METQKRDKRKILLFFPLLVMPFLALAFYATGGGSGSTSSSVTAPQGINTALPDAKFKNEEPVDKLGFYALGKSDTSSSSQIDKVADKIGFNGFQEDPKTVEINAKLEQLNKEINAPVVAPKAISSPSSNPMTSAPIKEDVDRLEMLMRSLKEDKTKDPEMEQMDALLQKILEIQNPSKAVASAGSKLDSVAGEREFLAVPAELAEGSKVINGSTIKLRLLDSVVLKNITIPKGHFVFGLCKIMNQRLLLDIKNIRSGNSIIPVDLSMYSLDGMVGISAPEAIVKESLSGGAIDAIGGVSVYGIEGIGGQVADAGIDAAKSLFSRRVKVVKVKLKAGERVLLKINRL